MGIAPSGGRLSGTAIESWCPAGQHPSGIDKISAMSLATASWGCSFLAFSYDKGQAMAATQTGEAPFWRDRLEKTLLAPVRALRPSYLPLLMVYFAYGATGLIGIAQAFWVRKSLTWSPAELSGLAIWF